MADEEKEQGQDGGGGASGKELEKSSQDVGAKGTDQSKGAQREKPGAGEVVRDMGLGALIGAAVGAVWRVARTVQPDSADAVKRSVAGAAREMATAAGNAVGDVLASKPVNQLLPTKMENGKRAEMMKSTLKEAVVAAGDAAKGVLESKGGGKSGDGEEK